MAGRILPTLRLQISIPQYDTYLIKAPLILSIVYRDLAQKSQKH